MKSNGGYNKGDLVSKTNPNSKQRSESLWKIYSEKVGNAEQDASLLMDEMLVDLLSIVETVQPFINEYTCDIQVAVFSDNEQINCFISNAMLKRLSSVGLNVLFSGYAGTSE